MGCHVTFCFPSFSLHDSWTAISYPNFDLLIKTFNTISAHSEECIYTRSLIQYPAPVLELEPCWGQLYPPESPLPYSEMKPCISYFKKNVHSNKHECCTNVLIENDRNDCLRDWTYPGSEVRGRPSQQSTSTCATCHKIKQDLCSTSVEQNSLHSFIDRTFVGQ